MPTIRVVDDNVIEFVDSNGDVAAREEYDEAASEVSFVDGDGNPMPVSLGDATADSVNTDAVLSESKGVGVVVRKDGATYHVDGPESKLAETESGGVALQAAVDWIASQPNMKGQYNSGPGGTIVIQPGITAFVDQQVTVPDDIFAFSLRTFGALPGAAIEATPELAGKTVFDIAARFVLIEGIRVHAEDASQQPNRMFHLHTDSYGSIEAYLMNVWTGNASQSVKLDGGWSCTFEECSFEIESDSGQPNVEVTDSTYVKINGSILGGGKNNLKLDGNSQCKVTKNRLNDANEHAVVFDDEITDNKYIIVSKNTIRNWGVATANTYDGVYVSGGGQYSSINGNQFIALNVSNNYRNAVGFAGKELRWSNVGPNRFVNHKQDQNAFSDYYGFNELSDSDATLAWVQNTFSGRIQRGMVHQETNAIQWSPGFVDHPIGARYTSDIVPVSTTASIETDTDYRVAHPCRLIVSGGSDVSIDIKDRQGNVVQSGLSSFDGWMQDSWQINFGGFTSEPNVKAVFG